MSRGHKILATALKRLETQRSFASGQSTVPTAAQRKNYDDATDTVKKPVKEAVKPQSDVPFEPDPKPKQKAVAGKHGIGFSTARHLARQGLAKVLAKEETVNEVLGTENEIGRPQLTRKWLKLTPGQTANKDENHG